MADEKENRDTAVALLDENEDLQTKPIQEAKRPRRNFCSETYLVPIGVPIIIVLLLIILVVLYIIYARAYNKNCKPTKGAKCRGILWYFT